MNLLILPVALLPALSPWLFLKKARRYLVLVAVIFMALTALYILLMTEQMDITLPNFFEDIWLAPLYFTLHPYGKIAAFGFLFVGAAAMLYGLNIMRPAEQAAGFIALSAALGVVFTGNFLVFYFFWELLTVSAAALILLKGSPESLKMGFRFLFIQLTGGLFLLAGILLHFTETGSLALAAPAAGLPLFVVGIGVKTAFIPLHFWLPWGYPAASFPVSVLLSALSTKVGVYAVARFLPAHEAIAFMGASMALFGVIFAVLQTDLRRLLSFHIISQVGYMVAGAGLGLAASVDGALLHLVNHMIYKALLFMSAGALIYVAGSENLHKLQGGRTSTESSIWKAAPVAVIGALAGALAITGVPPFNGYVSKYLLKYAVSGSGPLQWMLLLAGVGTALSFSKFVYFGFFRSRSEIKNRMTASMSAAIVILAAATVILGVQPSILAAVVPNGSSLAVYSISGVFSALVPVAAGIALFIPASRLLDPSKHRMEAGTGLNYTFFAQQKIAGIFKNTVWRAENISRAQNQFIFISMLTLSMCFVFFFLRYFK